MSDELETEVARDPLLQGFNIGIGKFDHATAVDVDEMIMMLARCRLVAAAAVLASSGRTARSARRAGACAR